MKNLPMITGSNRRRKKKHHLKNIYFFSSSSKSYSSNNTASNNNNGDAMKRFSNAKAISSDQFFNNDSSVRCRRKTNKRFE